MTDPKKDNGANLPMIGLGLILAAGAGVVVGWYMHKPPAAAPTKTATATTEQTPKTGAAARESDSAKPAEAAATGAAAGAPGAGATTTTPGLTGPCADWAKQICDASGGDNSADCKTTKRAAEMMGAAACQAALGDVGTALAAIQQAKQSCVELQQRLCKDIGEETDACKLVKEQTPNFPPDRCQSMLGQYDDVLKDLQRMEARNKPLAPEILAKMAEDNGAGAFGPVDAKVVVVEFSDFLCPYCMFAAQTVEKIRPRYSSVVRFVFRQFPLPMHGDNARLGSMAALAAGAQGKFWEMHDKLFAAQDALRQEGRPLVDRLAQEIGLDMTAFAAALDAKTYDPAVAADMALGESAFVDGTPSLFLNGKRMNVDPRDPAAFAKALDEALTAAGVPVPPPLPEEAAPPAPPAPAPAPAPAPVP